MNETKTTAVEEWRNEILTAAKQKPTKMLAREYKTAKANGDYAVAEILKQELKRRN